MAFSHEKLIVYQRAIEFVAWSETVLERLPANIAVKAQLDRASTSIPLNIAEGNGKFSAKDRARFFQIAQGLALECAACLDVLIAKQKSTPNYVSSGKALLEQIVNMLMKLLSTLDSRVAEDEALYSAAIREED